MPIPGLPYTDAELFPLTHGAVLGHGLLMVYPNWKHTPIVSLLIAGFYAMLYCILLTQVSKDQQPAGTNFNTLEGVIRLLSDRQNVFLAWLHFASFDLMVSRWIVADAWSQGIPHYLAALSISATWLLGPAGVICYLGLKSGYIAFFEKGPVKKAPGKRRGAS